MQYISVVFVSVVWGFWLLICGLGMVRPSMMVMMIAYMSGVIDEQEAKNCCDVEKLGTQIHDRYDRGWLSWL